MNTYNDTEITWHFVISLLDREAASAVFDQSTPFKPSFFANLPAQRLGLVKKVWTGDIEPQEAFAQVMLFPKPHATKEWKARRKTALGDCCANCGTEKGPLVIQHIHQPPTIARIRNAFALDAREIYERNKPSMQERIASVVPTDRPVCPRCGSTVIKYRVKKGIWECCSRARGAGGIQHRRCFSEFSEPDFALALTPAAKHKIAEIKRECWDKAVAESREMPASLARLVYLIAALFSDVYFSMQDTKTLCKRCAFKEDLDAGHIHRARIRKFRREGYLNRSTTHDWHAVPEDLW